MSNKTTVALSLATQGMIAAARKHKNKPFILPDDLRQRCGAGIWCMEYDGHTLFNAKQFPGLTEKEVADGFGERNIGMVQLHDADVGLGADSPICLIQDTAGRLAELFVPRGICIEGVTTAGFIEPWCADGPTTSPAEEIRRRALSATFKTLDLAKAWNNRIAEFDASETERLILKRVREMIGWGGEEMVAMMAKARAFALRHRLEHWAEVANYAVDIGVATPESPFWLSEEGKPWESAERCVIASGDEALTHMLTLRGLLKNKILQAIRLGGNPEGAHEDMAFKIFWQVCQLMAAYDMLACVHLNGEQARGVHDLDLAAMRKRCFKLLFGLVGYDDVPIILDVKPARTDGDKVQRFRVIDQSFRSLAWAQQAVAYVWEDPEVSQILSALGTTWRVDMMAPIPLMTKTQRRALAAETHDTACTGTFREITEATGTLIRMLEHRVDELMHREFAKMKK